MDANALNSNRPRFLYLDVLRVIACLLVILVHVPADYLYEDFTSVNFCIANISGCISKIGVPLFVMISGALFLDEHYEYSAKKIFQHVIKIVIFFCFWSLVYVIYSYVILPIIHNEPISFRSIFGNFVTGPVHLWFCFMIIGLYLIVPLLRLWVKKENLSQIKYFIILALIFNSLLPTIAKTGLKYNEDFNLLQSRINEVNISYVSGYLMYFILGWYLNNIEINHKKTLIVAGILGFIISFVGTYILSLTLNSYNNFCSSFTIHICLCTCMIFFIIKNKYGITQYDENKVSHKFIKLFSKLSMGIWALHLLFRDMFNVLIFNKIEISAIFQIPLCFIGTAALSLLFSYILSKIPLLKKLV